VKHQPKLGYLRILAEFYKSYGIKRLFIEIIKYSRLRYVLRKHGKVFRRRKKKQFILKSMYEDKAGKLIFLNILLQTMISRGKKKLSLKIFTNVLTLLKFKFRNDFVSKYLYSLERIRPLINYRTMFIGGKKYKIPVLMPITKSYKVGAR